MSLITGIKKLFSKKDVYASPNEYILNSKEKESVIVFFSSIFFVIIMVMVLLLLN